jgi:hypothetical protein
MVGITLAREEITNINHVIAVVTNNILEANSGLACIQSATLSIIGLIVSKSF